MKEYKKSYKGFVIWLVVWTIVFFGIALFPELNENIATLYTMNVMSIGMAVLTWMIYKGEQIYWYTGLTFEEAAVATSEQRKRYAKRHAVRFTWYAVGSLVYSLPAYFMDIPIGFSITVLTVGLVVVALTTMKIKL